MNADPTYTSKDNAVSLPSVNVVALIAAATFYIAVCGVLYHMSYRMGVSAKAEKRQQCLVDSSDSFVIGTFFVSRDSASLFVWGLRLNISKATSSVQMPPVQMLHKKHRPKPMIVKRLC